MLMRLHSAARSPSVDALIVERIRRAEALERRGQATGNLGLYDKTVQAAARKFLGGPKPNPSRL
jgi:hypothetical protein